MSEAYPTTVPGTPGRRRIARLAWALILAPLAACALDFDRFEPRAGADAGATPDAASKDETSGGEPADGATDDASPGDAGPDTDGDAFDAGADGNVPFDAATESGTCTPSPSCLDTAMSCGARCVQDQQSCAMRCNSSMCRNGCTRTETTCRSTCANACSSCTQDAGCRSSTACTNAAGH